MNLTNSVKHPPALMAVKRRSRSGVRENSLGEGGGGWGKGLMELEKALGMPVLLQGYLLRVCTSIFCEIINL